MQLRQTADSAPLALSTALPVTAITYTEANRPVTPMRVRPLPLCRLPSCPLPVRSACPRRSSPLVTDALLDKNPGSRALASTATRCRRLSAMWQVTRAQQGRRLAVRSSGSRVAKAAAIQRHRVRPEQHLDAAEHLYMHPIRPRQPQGTTWPGTTVATSESKYRPAGWRRHRPLTLRRHWVSSIPSLVTAGLCCWHEALCTPTLFSRHVATVGSLSSHRSLRLSDDP